MTAIIMAISIRPLAVPIRVDLVHVAGLALIAGYRFNAQIDTLLLAIPGFIFSLAIFRLAKNPTQSSS